MSYTNRKFNWDLDALKRFYNNYVIKWINSAMAWTDAQVARARANVGGTVDVSVLNAVQGTPATYESLTAALEAVPQVYKRGGMSVKFIQGSAHSSDNKYVQYRLMATSFSTTETDWQGVDDEPNAGSENLVKSGGVAKGLRDIHFICNGDTIVTADNIDFIIPNHTYKIYLKNKNIPLNELTVSNTFILNCYVYFNDGSERQEILRVNWNESLKDFYYLTIPSNVSHLRFNMRANSGEIQVLSLYDITYQKINITSPNIQRISENTIWLSSIRILDGYKTRTITLSSEGIRYTFSQDTYLVLVLDKQDNIVTRATSADILESDTVLLFGLISKPIAGGLLYPSLNGSDIGRLAEKTKSLVLCSNIECVSASTITLNSVRIIDNAGNDTIVWADPVEHATVSYEFEEYEGSGSAHLIVTNGAITLYRGSIETLSNTDIVLLSRNNSNGTFMGGCLLPMLNGKHLKKLNDETKQLVISSSLSKVTQSSVSIVSLRMKDNDGTDVIIYANQDHSSVVYDFNSVSDNISSLVVRNNAIQIVGGISNINDTDYILLVHHKDENRFIGGNLLPILNAEDIKKTSPNINNVKARNIHIALMNKYAQRYGVQYSTFTEAYTNAYICAKDLGLICVSAISNQKILSFWGKKIVYAPCYGAHPRLLTFENTYTDVASHPMVADLSDYYHIFGGKTGSGGNPSRGRNLVVAVKSKTDKSWLVGCVLYADDDVLGNNRFAVMKDLFDMLELYRSGTIVDTSTLRCFSAWACVIPNTPGIQNYTYDFNLVSIGKNETSIANNSHSTAKLMSTLVFADVLDVNKLITFNSYDAYVGDSGTKFQVGDQLYIIDVMTTGLITSSSEAIKWLARQVGEHFADINGADCELYSFRLLGHTAYGNGSQTWMEWLTSPDYLVWNAESGLSLTCVDNESKVLTSTQEQITADSISSDGITHGSVPIKGSDMVTPNTPYSVL